MDNQKIIDFHLHRGINRINPKDRNEFWCTWCKVYHPKSFFHRHSASPYQIKSYCKMHASEIKKGYVPKEELKPDKRKYKDKNIEDSPLSNCNRSTYKGFVKYYSNRPYHFEDSFGKVFTMANAMDCFVKQQLFLKAKFDI